MADDVYQVDIQINVGGAIAGLNSVRESATEANQSLELLKKSFEALEAILEAPIEQFLKLVEVAVDLVREYDNAYLATQKLDNALAAAGESARTTRGHLSDLADNLEKTSRFGRTAIESAEASAVAFGFQGDAIDRVVRVAANLAPVLGTDLAGAVSAVDRAITTGFLISGDRSRILLSSSSDAATRANESLAQLEQRYKSLGTGGAFQVIQFFNTFEKFKETLGDIVQKSAPFEAFFNVLTDQLDKLTRFLVANKVELQATFGEAFSLSMQIAAKSAQLLFDVIVAGIQKVTTLVANLSTSKVAGFFGFPQATGPAANAFVSSRNALQDAQDQINLLTNTNAFRHPQTIGDFQLIQQVDDLKSSLPGLTAELNKNRDALLGISDAKQGIGDLFVQLTADVDKLKEQLGGSGIATSPDALIAKIGEELGKIQAARKAQGETAGGEAQHKAIQPQTDIDTLTVKGVGSAATIGDAFEKAFASMRLEALDLAKTVGSSFDTVINGMTDAIVNFAKTGKFSFHDFAESVLTDLLRIYARQLLVGLVGGVGTALGFSGATTGSPAPTLVSGVSAGATYAAAGADAMPGQPFIVGERGPELFVPRSAGTIVPNGVGAPTIHVNVINVTNPDDINKHIASGAADQVILNRLSYNRQALARTVG